MRIVIVALALLSSSIAACASTVPNLTCRAVDRAVKGDALARNATTTTHTPTDVFRIQNGKLYHRWSGREEYFYNNIVQTELGRYVAGHIIFVIDDDRRGYAVTAGPVDWTVYYLDCKS